MNDRYRDINFDAFSAMQDCKLTETEETAYIENFYVSAGFHQDEGTRRKPAKKRFPRKFIVTVAAMVSIFAFGAVAYAAGWLNLGGIDDTKYGKYELIALENSAQYKAAKEIIDYENGLSWEEYVAFKEESNGEFEDGGETNEKEKSMTFRGPNKKVQEVLTKYDLEFERTCYYVNSAKKAFDKVGVGNILGDFWNIDDLKSNDSNVYNDGYTYGDKGSVGITGGGESPSDPIYWELHMVPRNVYLSPLDAFIFPDEKKNPEYTEWEFVTKEGYPVKACSYKVNPDLENAGGKDRINRWFKFLMITETHTIEMLYNVQSNDPNKDMSNQNFEDLVEKFDFSKLS